MGILAPYGIKPKFKNETPIAPGKLLVGSFLAVILLGTILLKLLPSTLQPISWWQALFTATSTTCVTGLNIVPPSEFTILGHWIILALMQIGGLGLMTLYFFLISWIAGDLGIAGRFWAEEILNLDGQHQIRSFLFMILKVTLVLELFGALTLFSQFIKEMNWPLAVFHSIFYSISAFCNAGICLSNSGLSLYQDNFCILSTLMLLTFLGSLGFWFFAELLGQGKFDILSSGRATPEKQHFSLHNRIIVLTNLFLIIGGMLLFTGLEYKLLCQLPWSKVLGWSLFHSICLRSSGFELISIKLLQPATLLLSTLWMIFGASPGSTGGGFKLTNFIVLAAASKAAIKGRPVIEILGRSIPMSQILKALAIIASAIAWSWLTTFLLVITDGQHGILTLFVENIASITTVGLSNGLTHKLSFLGQAIILINMLVGRIGALTFILAFKTGNDKLLYRFPEERLLLG